MPYVITERSTRHLRLLLAYARQAAQLVESGEVGRESLGRSVVHQLAATKALKLVGEQAWLLDRGGVDLDEGIDWSLVEEARFEDVPERVERLSELIRGQGTGDASTSGLCPGDLGELG